MSKEAVISVSEKPKAFLTEFIERSALNKILDQLLLVVNDSRELLKHKNSKLLQNDMYDCTSREQIFSLISTDFFGYLKGFSLEDKKI